MRPLLLAPFWLALAACALFGVPEPRGLDDRIAYANGMYTGLVEATTSALTLGTIHSSDARRVQETIRPAKEFLDIAKAMNDQGDVPGAEGNLELAIGVLTAVRNYLVTKGVQP